eukprot:scaffold89186_cov21-Prasinocladus_malaysianus.AAC.1
MSMSNLCSRATIHQIKSDNEVPEALSSKGVVAEWLLYCHCIIALPVQMTMWNTVSDTSMFTCAIIIPCIVIWSHAFTVVCMTVQREAHC